MSTQTLPPCECRMRGVGLLTITWLLAVVASSASGLLAGSGDMLAALGAAVISSALLQGRRVARSILLGWNTLGLLDFIVAVVVGTALRSSYPGAAVKPM